MQDEEGLAWIFRTLLEDPRSVYVSDTVIICLYDAEKELFLALRGDFEGKTEEEMHQILNDHIRETIARQN